MVDVTGRSDFGKSLQEASEDSSWRKALSVVSSDPGYSVVVDEAPEIRVVNETSLQLSSEGIKGGAGGQVSEANDCSAREDGEGAGERVKEGSEHDWGFGEGAS